MRALTAVPLTVAALLVLSACELVADFDRDKIPTDGPPSLMDGGTDADAGRDAAANPDAAEPEPGDDDAGGGAQDAD